LGQPGRVGFLFLEARRYAPKPQRGDIIAGHRLPPALAMGCGFVV